MSRKTTTYRRARSDTRRQLAAFHRSHRGTPVLGCPICTFGSDR
jgi:hypothetical protein